MSGKWKAIFCLYFLSVILCGAANIKFLIGLLPNNEQPSEQEDVSNSREGSMRDPPRILKGGEASEQDENESSILDKRLRAEARSLGKNPNIYRMLIRRDSDGARIYRQIGSFVIMYPDQEVVYIPDGNRS